MKFYYSRACVALMLLFCITDMALADDGRERRLQDRVQDKVK